jgi:uncharacterized protein
MMEPMDERALHERLHFDTARGEVRDGPRRYLLMRADVLMGLFERLPADAREQALQALEASVTENGGDSVRAYLAAAGADALLATMEQSAASLGWGRWRFEIESEALRLHVDNSPFAAAAPHAEGARACHAITGMLSAVAAALWGEAAQARETRCACAGPAGARQCTFEARQPVRRR